MSFTSAWRLSSRLIDLMLCNSAFHQFSEVESRDYLTIPMILFSGTQSLGTSLGD